MKYCSVIVPQYSKHFREECFANFADRLQFAKKFSTNILINFIVDHMVYSLSKR